MDGLFVFAVDAKALAEHLNNGDRLALAALDACALTLLLTSASMLSVEFHTVIVVHWMAKLFCMRLSWYGWMDTAWVMLEPSWSVQSWFVSSFNPSIMLCWK